MIRLISALVLAAVALTATAGAATPRIGVTAGKPSEFGFRLTTHVVRGTGTVVFTVRNDGMVTHNFKVCTAPRRNSALNTCNGKGSRKLAHGQSTTLTVVFKKKGTYEYLCTVAGHAAAGMKGLLTVR